MRCQYKKTLHCPSEAHNEDKENQEILGYHLCSHHERVVIVRILGEVFNRDEEIASHEAHRS